MKDRVTRIAGQRKFPPLRQLNRDRTWQLGGSRPQLEFVVDNETVAGLMNAEIQIRNEHYESIIARMRQNLFTAFSDSFDYKGGYFSCHDWRPREYNQQADAVCNWVLDDCKDVEDLDALEISTKLAAGQVLQLFSDDGYDGASGAASFVVVCSEYKHGSWHTAICWYKGIYMQEAHSSFQAELIAADAAITFAFDLGHIYKRCRIM